MKRRIVRRSASIDHVNIPQIRSSRWGIRRIDSSDWYTRYVDGGRKPMAFDTRVEAQGALDAMHEGSCEYWQVSPFSDVEYRDACLSAPHRACYEAEIDADLRQSITDLRKAFVHFDRMVRATE